MTIKFKQTGKVLGAIVGLLLLATQCTKFSEIDFRPSNRFNLDASAHKLEVRMRQINYFESEFINYLTINGVVENPSSLIASIGMLANQQDTIMHFENLILVCESHYTSIGRLWRVVEIHGEWFSIQPTIDGRAMQVSIAENNENVERTLGIRLFLDSYRGTVTIKQRGR
jgi:hypothetical protein